MKPDPESIKKFGSGTLPILIIKTLIFKVKPTAEAITSMESL